jgi:hypothetical protein
MQRQLKLLKLPEKTKTEGLRKMIAADVPKACLLLNEVIHVKHLCHRHSQYRLLFGKAAHDRHQICKISRSTIYIYVSIVFLLLK